jgi:hypothetical protein
MRVVLFILMLTLLPLRGWMGDAMATGMAVAELKSPSLSQIAMHSIADGLDKSSAGIGFNAQNMTVHQISADTTLSDCAGHTAADNMALDDDGHCTPCAACGACHSASMNTAVPQWAPAVHGSAPTARSADAFFSADTAAQQKPPIS